MFRDDLSSFGEELQQPAPAPASLADDSMSDGDDRQRMEMHDYPSDWPHGRGIYGPDLWAVGDAHMEVYDTYARPEALVMEPGDGDDYRKVNYGGMQPRVDHSGLEASGAVRDSLLVVAHHLDVEATGAQLRVRNTIATAARQFRRLPNVLDLWRVAVDADFFAAVFDFDLAMPPPIIGPASSLTPGPGIRALVSLGVSECGIGPEIAMQILWVIGNIEVLDLSGNPLGAGDGTSVLEMVDAMGIATEKGARLRHVNLGNCELHGATVADFLGRAATGSSLETLDLSNNYTEASREATDAFLELVRVSSSLKTLAFGGNPLMEAPNDGDLGEQTRRTRTALKRSIGAFSETRIRHILLHGTEINFTILDVIAASTLGNLDLERIDFADIPRTAMQEPSVGAAVDLQRFVRLGRRAVAQGNAVLDDIRREAVAELIPDMCALHTRAAETLDGVIAQLHATYTILRARHSEVFERAMSYKRHREDAVRLSKRVRLMDTGACAGGDSGDIFVSTEERALALARAATGGDDLGARISQAIAGGE